MDKRTLRNRLASRGGVPTPPANRPIEIKYGHNETQVVMIFSGPVQTLALTEAEAEAQIKSLTAVLQHLRESKVVA